MKYTLRELKKFLKKIHQMKWKIILDGEINLNKAKVVYKMKKIVRPNDIDYEYEQKENGDFVLKCSIIDSMLTLTPEEMHKLFHKKYDERG